jgi:O-antigen/teichoic acid export membrane protein
LHVSNHIYSDIMYRYFLYKFINKGHERSINARKNIILLFFIKGGSIIISLMLVPLTINYINPTRYGIWLTLSSIIGWLSFFDIGFGNGLRNKFIGAVAKGQHELARIYVSTTYGILSIIISILLFFFIVINYFLSWPKILNTPNSMASELYVLALITFVFFCLQFILQLLTTVIISDQKPAKAAFFNLCSSFLSLFIIFILTKTTHGNLIYLGFTLGATPVIVLIIASIWFYTHDYKCYAPSLKYIKFGYAKNLMSLGLKFFIIQISALILYESSNVIISQLFGPVEVTPYNIAYKYFGIIPMVFNIVLSPMWSAYAEAYVKNDIVWIKRSIRKVIKLWLLLCVVIFIMCVASNKIYSWWVPTIKIPFLLSFILAFYVLINTWCNIFAQFINGVGKLKLQLVYGLFGALINIPLAIFLGKKIGVSGVVLSTCIIGFFTAIWCPIQYYKVVNNKAKGIWFK